MELKSRFYLWHTKFNRVKSVIGENGEWVRECITKDLGALVIGDGRASSHLFSPLKAVGECRVITSGSYSLKYTPA